MRTVEIRDGLAPRVLELHRRSRPDCSARGVSQSHGLPRPGGEDAAYKHFMNEGQSEAD